MSLQAVYGSSTAGRSAADRGIYMKKFRQFFQEKIILSAVMCVLLLVVLVTGTYGWYALSSSARAYGIDLKNGGTGGIRVAVEEGGEDIMENAALPKIVIDHKEYAQIPIKLTEFINIEKEMTAPGAYNPITFYITSLAESIKSYSIKVQMEYKASEKITPAQKQEIETMIRDHIMVYQEMDTENGIVRFRDPLTYYEKLTDSDVKAATGALQYEVEVPVTLYWVWNYEVTDVPDYTSIARFRGLDERSAVRKYDEEDTALGNYIDGIWFNICIEGSPEGVKK